jgi:hypothetical protein
VGISLKHEMLILAYNVAPQNLPAGDIYLVEDITQHAGTWKIRSVNVGVVTTDILLTIMITINGSRIDLVTLSLRSYEPDIRHQLNLLQMIYWNYWNILKRRLRTYD